MATIKDIAKLAKVTPSTVSRVLNHSGGYSEKTRRRVEQIAREQHYQKNEVAVNLVAQSSNLIGVIVTNATTSFAAPIIDSIEDWSYQYGSRILLAHCGLNDSERLKECLNLMAGRKVKGIISISVQFDEANLKLLDQLKLPLISLGVKVSGRPMISIDNYDATLAGTKFLIAKGYQQIALVAVDINDLQTGRTRVKAYQAGMKAADLDTIIVAGDYSFAAGKHALANLIASASLPEAIFAASDDAAAGVIFAAQENGIKVPEQLAVLGFDNSPVAKMIYPGITTIAQPFKQMGQLALEYLNSKIGNSINLPFQIKERGSVRQG